MTLPGQASTFNGNPCKRGHEGLRYAVNGACVQCTREARNRSRQASNEENPHARTDSATDPTTA